MMERVLEIVAFSPRQLENEKKTAQYVMDFLSDKKIAFITEKYDVEIPHVHESYLEADGSIVPCEGSCFVSGEILGKEHVVSSLIFDQKFTEGSIINFNPQCAGISLPIYYSVPAVAVSRFSKKKLLNAKNIRGYVRVEHVKHEAVNILVGNLKNPLSICFAHYDSIESGAIDNASGVAVMMEMIERHPESLRDVLYVFAANEELSCANELYWGNGYRVFESHYEQVMERAQSIIVIDSVGNGLAKKISDMELLLLGFPIKNIKKWHDKISFVTGDFSHLMTVYHSSMDDGRGMTEEYMEDAYNMVRLSLNIHDQ